VSPRSFSSRITEAVHEFGFPVGMAYLFSQALSRVSPNLSFQLYEFMAQPVRVHTRRGRSKVSIREIRSDDPLLQRMPVRPEVMASRIAQRATCLGAFDPAGELIGYMWFREGEYEEDEVRCTYAVAPANQAVFDFDFYLMPEHRMGTAFASLWNGVFDEMSARGIRYTFSRMTRFNLASRRAHLRLGSAIVGRAMFLKLFRVELMLSTVAPYAHLSLNDGHRVRLVLSPPPDPAERRENRLASGAWQE